MLTNKNKIRVVTYLKIIAIQNQLYEVAAGMRDIEKSLFSELDYQNILLEDSRTRSVEDFCRTNAPHGTSPWSRLENEYALSIIDSWSNHTKKSIKLNKKMSSFIRDIKMGALLD